MRNEGYTPQLPEEDIKSGDRIKYTKDGSEHDGMIGIFLGVREDGKYHIRFDDGTKLAATPHHVTKIDEEDIGEDVPLIKKEPTWNTKETSDLDYLDKLRKLGGAKESYTKNFNEFVKKLR